MGKFVDLSMFVPIINGKSEGKAKLYHSNNPFFADLMISFGKIIIKTLKYIAKIVIMLEYVNFLAFINLKTFFVKVYELK